MNALVASGWFPTPLMEHIENNRDAILTANKKKYSLSLSPCAIRVPERFTHWFNK